MYTTVMTGLPARDGLPSRWRVERLSHGVTHGLDKGQATRLSLWGSRYGTRLIGALFLFFYDLNHRLDKDGKGHSERL